jgi:hypothetical protein
MTRQQKDRQEEKELQWTEKMNYDHRDRQEKREADQSATRDRREKRES